MPAVKSRFELQMEKPFLSSSIPFDSHGQLFDGSPPYSDRQSVSPLPQSAADCKKMQPLNSGGTADFTNCKASS
ncbi:MAG: hypothetical protein MJ062_02730 [Oscillospiraceae bacterium]|nr:hypothetical protein [Oscillospiraceae bacterium]